MMDHPKNVERDQIPMREGAIMKWPAPPIIWLTASERPSYIFRMTNMVTFRPKRSKRELKQRFGNVSEKLNELIERELAGQASADWRDVLQRARPQVTDDDYNRCLTFE
jgi:hypothetical protein